MISWTVEQRVAILLSMQRALWEIPTPDLRGVAVGTDDGVGVVARFYYDGPVTQLHRELVALAETYLLADFGSQMTSRFEAVQHPVPLRLDLGTLVWWVYLRWEPTSWGAEDAEARDSYGKMPW